MLPGMTFPELARQTVGFFPDTIAVLGKWDPFLPATHCLDELGARAAAALAVWEALQSRPYLLTAGARLRRQPRPGCIMAAETLARLGADPGRIRCCAAANRTWNEVQVLDRMRGNLGARNLLLVTSDYHVHRARALVQELAPGFSGQAPEVLAVQDPLVRQALLGLPASRRARLERAIRRGEHRGLSSVPTALGELAARVVRSSPWLQSRAADVIRGRPGPALAPMFRPELSEAPGPDPAD